MREVKYRAWDKVYKRMLPIACLYFDKRSNFVGIYIGDEENDEWTVIKSEHIKLMQYTGLKDKNGVEIYEGDITIDNHGTLTVVENDGFQWIERVVKLRDVRINKDFLIMNKVNTFRCEVIGNIYENPELIEVNDDV